MMKYKFNPYERAVGLFISVAIAGSFFVGIGVAVKKNWFEEKIAYVTYVESASNLRTGSSVYMSGLRVGKIDKIEIDLIHNIKVTFSVIKKYSNKMTVGSKVEFIRPFILGDKALTLHKGPADSKMLLPGDALPVHDSMDILEMLSGKKLENVISKVESILNNMDETLAISKDIALQIGDKKKLKRAMDDLSFASSEVRKVIPHLTSRVPESSQHMAKTIQNLSLITTSLREIQPEGSKKAVDLLSESLIILKGMQKSFFLKSNVQEVREELAEEKKEKDLRKPAGE